MGSGQESGAQRQYGKLASLVYQLDKPVGTSFGDVEFYQGLLSAADLAAGDGRVRRFAQIAIRHADDHRSEIEAALAARPTGRS